MPLDHLPPATTILPPTSHMPFPRNPQFVGRDQTLMSLALALADPAPTIMVTAVVSGLGGMGKTSLAVEFVYRYAPYFAGGVFWLNCATPEAIPTEVAGCAGALGLAVVGLPLDAQVAAVRRAWDAAIPRLLVFDNCDDPQILAQWRPPHGGSRVLVTARRRDWPGGYQVALHSLARPDSIALVQTLAAHVTASEADRLAAALGDLPLALFLAGRYLARVHGHETPAQYLEHLESPALLDHPAFTGRALPKGEILPTRHEQNVANTFALSLNQLDPADLIDALARHLLGCLAGLAPGEPVPRTLLWAMLPAPTPIIDGVEALERLSSLGVVDEDRDGAVRVHRLVHRVLHSVDLDAVGTQRLVAVVCQQADALNDQWHPETIAPLLPHLRWLLDHVPEPLTIGLLHELGDHATSAGEYATAQDLCDRALALSTQHHGPDAPLTATSLNHLGTLAYARGDYAAAQTAYTQALAIRERILGPTDPATASTLNNLAAAQQALGDLDNAQTHYAQALAIREAVRGPAHPTTALTLSGLAGVAQARGDLETAQTMYERALAIQEQALGPGHPAAITTRNNLGTVVTLRGDDAAARTVCEQAVAQAEQTLGPMHPATATSLHNLAYLDYLTGTYPDAIERFERALAIMEAMLGPGHAHVARTLNNLALVRVAMGAAAAARPLVERALAITEATLGPTHPATQQIRTNLDGLNARLAATAENPEHDPTAGQHPADSGNQND